MMESNPLAKSQEKLALVSSSLKCGGYQRKARFPARLWYRIPAVLHLGSFCSEFSFTVDVNESMRSTLSKVREDLLDLGLRNPLLNYRLLKTRGLEIAGAQPATLYNALVSEKLELPFCSPEVALLFTSDAAGNVKRLRLREHPRTPALRQGTKSGSQRRLQGSKRIRSARILQSHTRRSPLSECGNQNRAEPRTSAPSSARATSGHRKHNRGASVIRTALHRAQAR
jgi:hypothetical protein